MYREGKIHMKNRLKGFAEVYTTKRFKKPFMVSLNSRKRKGVTTNFQVQKRLESLLQKHGKVGKSQQEGGFIGAILAATAPLWLPLAVKGVKQILH